MTRNPEWYANQVDSRESFLVFLEVLREDRERADEEERFPPAGGFDLPPGGWENSTITEYLLGMETFSELLSLPDQPTWQLLARLLVAGKNA